jgi:TPP-dependent pyruvate/acetoin dehydrogenase alpha subunit
LAPADFFLFPRLKSTLKGLRFQTIQEITENSQTESRAISKRRTDTVSRRGNGVGSGASVQEGSTLRAIRLTQLQACPKNYKKIVPTLLEQTTYRQETLGEESPTDGSRFKSRNIMYT